ncbi:sensor histidine kinase [Streptomyces sp. SP18CS02]|uniref:sensor histidine kinase n=1 Tax=Streptomyces sp. SP18CS02 TaxID=3002531 RepID=UPI002E7A5E8C|nr:ATP-binding protein [Streptomyces sp. SP18CS02]MEE1755218.1 ATP-binding protein [Streptomyces sp. SP18CS02]
MSQLRAPVARPDRREGGRHGRPGARSLSHTGRPHAATPSTEARIRPQLLRVSVLPAVVVALGGAAAVLFTIRSTDARPTPGLWGALTGSAALAVAAVAVAALGADRAAKAVLDRCNALRRSTARGQNELRAVVEQLRRGERPPVRQGPPPPSAGGDGFDLLAEELGRSHEAAVAAVVQASRLSSSVGNEQKVEVFVNLARRLQSLVHREIQLLDELENEVEDPELLKGLFHVDHLATRIRRHAENLAVLGGAMSRRQWSNPVTMTEVLRSSIAEVEQYPRVKLVPPIDGTLRGHAVADVIHLLAELVENATLFSAPHTTVLLRAQHVTAGLAIEVEDRGLGMPVIEQDRMNALLTDPDQVNVAHLLQDGRIGLFVVSALARRHGIAVRLQSNIYGGVQAVLVLPQGLLGAETEKLPQADRHPSPPASHQPASAASAPHPTPAVPAAPPVRHAPATPVPTAAPEPARRRPVHVATEPPVLPGGPHGPAPHYAPEPAPRADGSAPLPLRGSRAGLPDPPLAPPAPRAPRPADSAAEHHRTAAQPPEPPRQDALHGSMSRPQLPKRRAQEHLVPQLRDAPAPRDSDDLTLHDPGLMAAFQRGIGLAESMPAKPVRPEPQRHDDAHKE